MVTLPNYSNTITTPNTTNISPLEKELEDLKSEKEFTISQEKLDFLDDQIFEVEDSIKKLNGN